MFVLVRFSNMCSPREAGKITPHDKNPEMFGTMFSHIFTSNSTQKTAQMQLNTSRPRPVFEGPGAEQMGLGTRAGKLGFGVA